MAIVMNMSSYEIERDPAEAGGDKHTLHFWQNPVPVPGLQPYVSTNNKHNALPADLATIDVELFLRGM